jgi:hypothetical protein
MFVTSPPLGEMSETAGRNPKNRRRRRGSTWRWFFTFSGLLEYRALYVDYERGQGRRRYEFDVLQHGPVVEMTMRF